MRQKIEEDDKEEFKKMEADYDVIALMKTIKKLSYTNTKTCELKLIKDRLLVIE